MADDRYRRRSAYAGRRIQRRIRQPSGPRAGQDGDFRGAEARRRRGRPGLRGHHGADPHRRSGPEPGPPGLDRGRHPGRKPGLGREPALRLGPARGRARLSGDHERRLGDRGRGRAGVHEHGAARAASAWRHQDGLARAGRYHDQGRAVGCLQRLSHGHDRRERRQEVSDHPRPAGRVRGRFAEQGRGRAEGRQVQGRDRRGDDQGPQGRHRGRHRRISEGRRHAGIDLQAAPGVRQGRRRDRRECLGHQRRRRRAGADERQAGRQGRQEARSPASCPGRMPASIRRSWAPGRSRPRAPR